jgi:acyl-coenzyme A thioesterase 9
VASSAILPKRTLSGDRILTIDKSDTEALAGTMQDVKNEIMKRMGLQAHYSPIVSTREHLAEMSPTSQSSLPARSMQDSFTSAVIPLSTDLALRDKYVGFMGNVRLGRLMEDMDMFAVWIVHNHIKLPDLPESVHLPYTFVTILVDKIDFTDLEPKHDADIRLSGHVSWIGKSSLEVVVWMEQRRHGKWRKLTRALFLMAARDATNTRVFPFQTVKIFQLLSISIVSGCSCKSPGPS